MLVISSSLTTVVSFIVLLAMGRPQARLMERQKEKELKKRGFTHLIGVDEAGRGALAGPIVAAAVVVVAASNENDSSSSSSSTTPLIPIPSSLVVNDCKRITPAERERIYEQLVALSPSSSSSSSSLESSLQQQQYHGETILWEISKVSSTRIDEINVQNANMEVLAECVETLVSKYSSSNNNNNIILDPATCYAIFDGKKAPKLSSSSNTSGNKITGRPMVKSDAQIYQCALASIVAKVTRDRLMVNVFAKEYPEYGFEDHKGYASPAHIEAIHKYGPCPIHRMSCKQVKGR